MNNKYLPLVVVAVVALLVGLFGGYYYEKTKLAKMISDQAQNYQMQLDEAKKTASENSTQPTEVVPQPVMMASSKLGNIVTDDKGMTLYTFDKDKPNVSNCTGVCLTYWPPYVVSGTVLSSLPLHLGTFKNAQGQTQYTWNSMPLYYYAGDKVKGDVTGDGVQGTWHVAK